MAEPCGDVITPSGVHGCGNDVTFGSRHGNSLSRPLIRTSRRRTNQTTIENKTIGFEGLLLNTGSMQEYAQGENGPLPSCCFTVFTHLLVIRAPLKTTFLPIMLKNIALFFDVLPFFSHKIKKLVLQPQHLTHSLGYHYSHSPPIVDSVYIYIYIHTPNTISLR